MSETLHAATSDTTPIDPSAKATAAGDAVRASRRSPRRTLRRRTLLQVPTPQLSLTFGPECGNQAVDSTGESEEASPAQERALEVEDLPSAAGTESSLAGSAHETAITPGIRSLSLDDFAGDLDRAEEIGRRTQVVRAMLRGASAREALIEAGLPTTRARWAQKLLKTWRETQRLTDGRWDRVTERTKLTPDVEQHILLTWNGRRRAGARTVWRKLRNAINTYRAKALAAGQHVQIEVPSYEAVRGYLKQLPKPLKMVRNGGMAEWTKHGRPFLDYEPSDYANHVAQIDHCRLKIWIRVEVSRGVWEARVAWFTVVFDVHSRAVLGYQLSTRTPDQWTMALALRHGILPKAAADWPMRGIPEVLVPDQGADFMSHAAARLCKGLGIRIEPTPPYYPDMKAEIERFFGTINSFLSELVGFMPADGRSPGAAAKRVPMLLTLPELRAEMERFLAEYHARPHGGIEGEAPAARWLDTVRHLALPATEEDLNVLLLKDDVTRIVTKAGIRFTATWQELSPPPDELPEINDRDLQPVTRARRGRYWAPELMDYLGEEVRVSYNPEDLESVLVYSASTGERLCEAWLVNGANGRMTPERLRSLRAAYRKGLRERTSAYAEEVAKDDRRSARAADQARAKAREMAGRALGVDGTVDANASPSERPDGTTSVITPAVGCDDDGAEARAAGRSTAKRGPKKAPSPEVVELAAKLERRARGEA